MKNKKNINIIGVKLRFSGSCEISSFSDWLHICWILKLLFKLHINEFSYKFDTVLYQFLETGKLDRYHMCIVQCLIFSGFFNPFHFSFIVPLIPCMNLWKGLWGLLKNTFSGPWNVIDSPFWGEIFYNKCNSNVNSIKTLFLFNQYFQLNIWHSFWYLNRTKLIFFHNLVIVIIIKIF